MEELLTVKTYSTRIEAEVGKGELGSYGVKSIIMADDAGGQEGFLLNATGFVKLMVSRKDFDKAVKLIAG